MSTLDFNWTTLAVALLNLLVGGVLVALVKNRPAMRRIDNEREANLLKERADEMVSMRNDLKELRAEMERRDEEHRKAMEAKETFHMAERRADTHRINNLSQCLDALLLLIKQDPAKAAEAAENVMAMRERQLQRESEERAAIRAAAIAAGHAPSERATT